MKQLSNLGHTGMNQGSVMLFCNALILGTCIERPWNGSKGGLLMEGLDVWVAVVAGSTTFSIERGLLLIQLSGSMSVKQNMD
jgi:hypothetical protein